MAESVEVLGTEELQRVLDGDRWWEAYRERLPQVMDPIVERLPDVAPKRTGRLANAGFAYRIKPFEHGMELDIAALEPYGHLPERGWRKVPRGPVSGTKRRRRKALTYRRLFGSLGFVPGQYFALRLVEEMLPGALATLELLVAADMERP